MCAGALANTTLYWDPEDVASCIEQSGEGLASAAHLNCSNVLGLLAVLNSYLQVIVACSRHTTERRGGDGVFVKENGIIERLVGYCSG